MLKDRRQRYRRDGAWADMARFQRLKSLYYACAARIIIANPIPHEKYRYMALYWQICFKNAKKCIYLYAYYLALKNYFQASSRIQPDSIYRHAEKYCTSKYENCMTWGLLTRTR